MASFFGKGIPWLPAQLPENSDFCHLESYLYAIKNNIISMSSDEMRSLVCTIICDRISNHNLVGEKASITKENLTLSKIEKFLSQNANDHIYKFGGNDMDEFSFPTIFRTLDYYNIQELKLFLRFIYKEVFDPELRVNWYHFALYCRSDYFVYSTSLDVLVNSFTSGIRPEYSDGKPYPPWAIVNEYDWASIDGFDLEMAAGFLFSWNRCKGRLMNHNDLYVSCEKLAEEACNLLLKNHNADGSWDRSTLPSEPEYELKLMSTSLAVLGLSLCHNEKYSNAISDAHDWLLCRLKDDIFLNNSLYPHYDSVYMDAVLLSDEDYGRGHGIVSFSIDSYMCSGNGPKLPRAHIKFLHVSDIHFSIDIDNAISSSIRKDLVAQIGQLVKNGSEISDLIITGDYRHARSTVPTKEAIEDAVNYINELAKAAHITNPEHIHLIPGNHDINRKYLKATVSVDGEKTTYHDLYRISYFNKKGLLPDEAFKKIGSQLYFFRMVSKKIYNKDNPWEKMTGKKQIHTYRFIEGTVFLYLNTAVFHHSDDDRGSLIIGVHYIEDVLSEISELHPNVPIVVLAHHSPDFFDLREKNRLEKLFIKYPVCLYLCGDAHMPWWRMTNGHLEFTAGCVKDEDGSQAEFLYGNAAAYSFTSYLWDNHQGWGEFSAFNTSLNDFLEIMNMK